ncbi:MAG: TIGR01212 family radical SAM protein [Candidatus Omnitrophota bacterium]
MNYYSFREYIKGKYGERVKKIGLNAGFGCPNRDGSIGTGGCIFCNEDAFSNFAESRLSIKEQIERSMKEMTKSKDVRKFIAYFQNGTSTNADIEALKKAYDSIKAFPEIVGISISTRPDCVNDEKLDLIAGYSEDYEVWVEYGMQTINDDLLKKMNRGHTALETIKAIEKTAKKNINVGVHIMLGAPGQSRTDIIETAKTISDLPVRGVKVHLMHVLKDTLLEKMYAGKKIKVLEKYEYIRDVCDLLEHLREDCIVLRLISDAKRGSVIAPRWMDDKLDVIRNIDKEFAKRGTKQGSRVER